MSKRFQNGAYHIVLEDALEGATPHDCDTGMTCCDGCTHTGHLFQDLPEGHPALDQQGRSTITMTPQRINALSEILKWHCDPYVLKHESVLREMLAESKPNKAELVCWCADGPLGFCPRHDSNE